MDGGNLTDDEIRAEAFSDLVTAFNHAVHEATKQLHEASTPAWELYWTTRLRLLLRTQEALPDAAGAA